MMLRPRQREFVSRCVAALKRHGNTLGVAPTGAGKTVMLSAATGEFLMNRTKFGRVNPAVSTTVFDAHEKSWDGQAVFAMVQTLARHTGEIPTLDLLVVDEAHHSAAPSYRRVIDTVLARNPHCLLLGVTATPNRGDRKGLREVYSNVADQIRLGELIRSGHLVPPRTFVIDVGATEQLGKINKTAADFDMNAVADIMNRSPVNEAVVRHWKGKAAGRKTIVFASTVEHARAVAEEFRTQGINAVLVHGELSMEDRRTQLAAFESGQATVVVNVGVLTEGYDYTPASCVVLLRPSSYKSTLIQMVGRGLRTVDPAEHPGVIKTDCIVLDFGTASLMHGCLEQEIDLNGEPTQCSGEALTKNCPDCKAVVPLAMHECPLCGHEFDGQIDTAREMLTDFVMAEIDLLRRSSFVWCDLFGDDCALFACGFNAWAGVFFLDGRWYAVLGVGERLVCLAQSDDWLNNHESDDAAHKTRAWLNQTASAKQIACLPPQYRLDLGLSKYRASTLIKFRQCKPAIVRLVETSNDALSQAA
jgi:DNA repair protein RadD